MTDEERAIKKSIELWVQKFPMWGPVVWMHHNGMTASEIDAKLVLKPGTSRRCMIRYWRFCDQLEKDGIIEYVKPRKPGEDGGDSGAVQDVQAGSETDRAKVGM